MQYNAKKAIDVILVFYLWTIIDTSPVLFSFKICIDDIFIVLIKYSIMYLHISKFYSNSTLRSEKTNINLIYLVMLNEMDFHR